MDLNSIKDQVSNLSLYDLKAGVRKVQNAVMNYTDMEAKVREATNNEPWGASSTLMQEIANGTHSYHLLNEIMPMIYKRFTEKAAEEWRQIYKSLQLLEFLIKNGSERVIDDARSHLSLLKMLRQFHFIDQNGKDQGINVRNRSKELAELLSDVDRIRNERKKARSNRNKFGGVEGGAGAGGPASGSRYGGFGSEEGGGYGAYSGGVYGDGGGFGGRESDFQDASTRRDRFEEYDEYDEGGAPSARAKSETTVRKDNKKTEPQRPKEPEIDILGFDDDIPPETPPKAFSASAKQSAFDNGIGSLRSGGAEDDDFDDFQSASPSTSSNAPIPNVSSLLETRSVGALAAGTQSITPTPIAPPQSTKIKPLSSFTSPSPAPSASSSILSPPAPNYNIDLSSPPPKNIPSSQPFNTAQTPQQPSIKPTSYQAAQPNYFTSVPAPTSASPAATGANVRPSISSGNSFSKPASKPSSAVSGDAFGNLWSTASAGAGIKNTAGSGNSGPNLASLQREKASQGIWGHSAATSAQPQVQQPTMGKGMAFGQSNGHQGGAGNSGLDDLLG